MQKSVLIVEDEFLIALDLTLVLEKHGWHVLGPAASTVAALRLLAESVPAVALLDVNLNDGPVTPVAEALRARNVPFVVATAHDQPELYGGEVLAGVTNVGKPADVGKLLSALELCLSA